jgi:hypothetical protein
MVVRRPIGIAILAVLNCLAALPITLLGVLFFVATPSLEGRASGISVGLGLVFLVLGGIGFALGRGLWCLKAWAWWLQVVSVGLGSLMWLLIVITANENGGDIDSAVLQLVVAAGVLIYLLSYPIRTAFGISGSAPAGTVTR